MVKVLPPSALIVPSTPFPLVCITLSRNERNCAMAFFTSRFAAFSMAFSGWLVAYSTSLVISTACRKKIGVTCATS
jgi:hypothetical protein